MKDLILYIASVLKFKRSWAGTFRILTAVIITLVIIGMFSPPAGANDNYNVFCRFTLLPLPAPLNYWTRPVILGADSIRYSDWPTTRPHLYKQRFFWLGSLETIFFAVGYQQAVKSWGVSNGKFHLKNDWLGDGLAGNDEVSHLWFSAELVKLFTGGFRWVGYDHIKAARLGALQGALLMTFVEFPLDAFNPTQGLGVSDLIFNYLGVGFGYWKTTDSRLGNIDLKISILGNPWQYNNQVFAQAAYDFDQFAFWATYRVPHVLKDIMVLGVGYSTSHPALDGQTVGPVKSHIKVGLGTTLSAVAGIVSPSVARFFKPVDFYYFNFHINAISW